MNNQIQHGFEKPKMDLKEIVPASRFSQNVRPTVVLVLTVNWESLLVVQSAKDPDRKTWGLVQEGIKWRENLYASAIRGCGEELGVVPNEWSMRRARPLSMCCVRRRKLLTLTLGRGDTKLAPHYIDGHALGVLGFTHERSLSISGNCAISASMRVLAWSSFSLNRFTSSDLLAMVCLSSLFSARKRANKVTK